MIDVNPKTVATVVKAVMDAKAYQGVKYLGHRLTIKVTRRHKPSARDTRQEFVITVGAPGYKEAEFIKRTFKAGNNLPVRPVLKFKTYKK